MVRVDTGSSAGAGEPLKATVERTVYHDADSRYTVLRISVPGSEELLTAVGRTHGIEDGAQVELRGRWDRHPTHGRQFSFAAIEVARPKTPLALQRRLTRYPGIKDVMAERIVAKFGLQVLDILDKQPRRLLEVEGLGPKTLERIVAFHKVDHGPLSKIEAVLAELDLPQRLAEPLLEKYGEEALDVLRTRPYRLAKELRGVGFQTADRIARALGIGQDSPERVEAGLVHVLEKAESDGHCALPIERLRSEGRALLGVSDAELDDAIRRLLLQVELTSETVDGEALIFSHRHLRNEQSIASSLVDLALADAEAWEVPALPEELSDGQRRAVAATASHRVSILTGGPGTGKSTVLRHVLDVAEAAGAELQLAAPTGRAAKRLEEATGRPAKTIHRLLEVQGDSGRFQHGAHNPLPPGLLVVDEVSMLDAELARALFSALDPEHRLLLVGDSDQLPSVGAGNVLGDLLTAAEEGDAIAVTRLDRIFRQAEGSSIVESAHRILAGEMPEGDSGPNGQFYVIAAPEAQRAHDRVVEMVTERIPTAFGLDPVEQVQVLCPMHKGAAGTESINRSLQGFHTAGRRELELPGRVRRLFRVGDRVMQTRNDYDKSVFNGDIGTVAALDGAKGSLQVAFEGRTVAYDRRDAHALTLAYAVSIHKSQGSEFPAVVIPLLAEHHVMLRRNLLYTAVTRAQRLCVLIGDRRAILRAVSRGDAGHRYTGLAARVAARLRDSLGEAEIIQLFD